MRLFLLLLGYVINALQFRYILDIVNIQVSVLGADGKLCHQLTVTKPQPTLSFQRFHEHVHAMPWMDLGHSTGEESDLSHAQLLQ